MTSTLVARLVAVMDRLGATTDVAALLQQISDSTHALLAAYAVGLVSPDEDQLQIVAGTGRAVTGLIGRRFPLATSAVAELVDTGERSLLAEGGRFPQLDDELFEGPPLRLAVALTRADGAGALYVLREAALSVEEREVLELLAAAAGAALRTAQAHVGAAAEVAAAAGEKDAVIAAMADGLVVLDAHDLVRSWNPALVTITGIPAAAAVGRPVPFPLPSGGGVLTHQLPHGPWIEILVAPVGGSSDRVVDVRDVSRLQALEAAKDIFLAAASHELRTPLTVLRGFAETLLHHSEALGDVGRHELVTKILARTQAMTGLVEQLLLGARAGAGVDVQVRPFDLAAAVRTAGQALSLGRDGHQLMVRAEGELLALGDESAIDGIVGQLVENAVKYSPAGGAIEVGAVRKGRDAVLLVADTGVGIATEDLERVFERFARGAGTAGERVGGVGLGLWIVRQHVEAQGGTVAALRRAGGGTIVEVRLPLVQ